jgi:hypothetical protein
MAIEKANQLLFLSLMAVLSLPACRAQLTQVPVGDSSQQAIHTAPALTEMVPPKPPKVTCAGDQMTISADNSTLGGVLAAVHACIGVQVDIPEGASESRVFEDLGPGPARQVLETLLNGTDFNFVIVSSNSDPQKIESVLLMLRPTETASTRDGAPDHSASAMRRAWLQSRQNRAASLAVDENRPAQEETPSATGAEDAPEATPESAVASPAQVPANDSQPAAAEAPSPSGDKTAAPISATESQSTPSPSAGSTPAQGTEQMINDMQQLFQQRRQMNQNQSQNQNPTSPQP